jgi:hypothetical protein
MHAVLSIGKCYDHRFGLESLCISSDIKIMPVADLVKEVSESPQHFESNRGRHQNATSGYSLIFKKCTLKNSSQRKSL